MDCWNNTLELAAGAGAIVNPKMGLAAAGAATTIELARRERPELVHDERGRPVALINGAQFGSVPGNTGDQTFTLVQAVRQS